MSWQTGKAIYTNDRFDLAKQSSYIDVGRNIWSFEVLKKSNPQVISTGIRINDVIKHAMTHQSSYDQK